MTLVTLRDVIILNPKYTIKKNRISRKIPMDALVPFQKHVFSNQFAMFSGGTKFSNGDTLVARITPSLENGKTAFIDSLEKNEIAFGSTEFIVLQGTDKITNEFVYYLATSPKFRKVAIKSMTGTSGRQRVQLESILNFKFELPDLEKQEKYTEILSNIDYKIQLNKQINDNLDELKQTYWHNLDKPVNSIFSDIMQISSGKRPPVKTEKKSEDTPIPIIGASKVMGWTNVALIDESILTTGRVGTHGVIQRFNKPVWVSDNSFILKSNFEETVYQVLGTQIDFKGLNHGSTQPLISQTDLKKYEIALPTNSDIEKFETFASKLNQKQVALELENENLVILRDSLLPKLLSGEIELN